MSISTAEQITYIALYCFALCNYGRFLGRFYFYHFPFIKYIEYGLAILLLWLFLHIIKRYQIYWVRLVLILLITLAPRLLRFL